MPFRPGTAKMASPVRMSLAEMLCSLRARRSPSDGDVNQPTMSFALAASSTRTLLSCPPRAAGHEMGRVIDATSQMVETSEESRRP